MHGLSGIFRIILMKPQPLMLKTCFRHVVGSLSSKKAKSSNLSTIHFRNTARILWLGGFRSLILISQIPAHYTFRLRTFQVILSGRMRRRANDWKKKPLLTYAVDYWGHHTSAPLLLICLPVDPSRSLPIGPLLRQLWGSCRLTFLSVTQQEGMWERFEISGE